MGFQRMVTRNNILITDLFELGKAKTRVDVSIQ